MPDNGTIITTPDGSRTALNERYGEAYGSRHGAAAQAHHVFLQGTETDTHAAPRVLEIGFGVGVNFRATLANTTARGAPLHYLAYEFDPAPAQVLKEVAEGGEGAELQAWGEIVKKWAERPLTPRSFAAPPSPQRRGAVESQLTVNTADVSLTVYFADALTADLPSDWATAIYLDGFSPTRNPEVWTPEFVGRLAGALAPGGIVATYSAAGHVRRAMQDAGLRVERRPGAPGKRECLRAVKG